MRPSNHRPRIVRTWQSSGDFSIWVRHRCPQLCISGQRDPYKGLLEQQEGITFFAKPVSLKRIKEAVVAELGARVPEEFPFGVTEYIQLACLGVHSVVIDVKGDRSGRIVVSHGELWSAQIGDQATGTEAFVELALLEKVEFECNLMKDDPGARNIETPWQSILIECARRRDERCRQV